MKTSKMTIILGKDGANERQEDYLTSAAYKAVTFEGLKTSFHIEPFSRYDF